MHVTALTPAQTPAVQASIWVQALLSSQVVPSGSAGFEHMPLIGSHAPAIWHESVGAHMTGFAPEQTPPRQVSVCVQPSLSLHAMPSGLTGFEHMPVIGLQTPTS